MCRLLTELATSMVLGCTTLQHIEELALISTGVRSLGSIRMDRYFISPCPGVWRDKRNLVKDPKGEPSPGWLGEQMSAPSDFYERHLVFSVAGV